MPEEEKKRNQINIELKEDIAQGVYSNLAVITHSSSEFVLDFIRVMPGIPKADNNNSNPITNKIITVNNTCHCENRWWIALFFYNSSSLIGHFI